MIFFEKIKKDIIESNGERGEEVYSPILSDIDYIEDTNTRFITFGSLSRFATPSFIRTNSVSL